MYKLLLILRYLRKRRIAWFALAAVTLCTTMVLVVISVMGGWLDMFEHSFQGLTGDIIVESGEDSLTGFPHYQEIIDEILKPHPELHEEPDQYGHGGYQGHNYSSIEAAVPTIHTFGIVSFSNEMTPNAATVGVQVMGIPIDKIGTVNRFPESLWMQHNRYLEEAKTETKPERKAELLKLAEEGGKHPNFNLPLNPRAYEWARTSPKSPDPMSYPGLIAGSAVVGIRRNSQGVTTGRDLSLYRNLVRMTTIAIRPGEASVDANDKNESRYWLSDDSHTGMWQYDNNFVYVPFEKLQKDLMMDESKSTDEKSGAVTVNPARTSDIHIRVKPGYDLDEAAKEVGAVVKSVMAKHANEDRLLYASPSVETWREKQHVWIDAIQHEKLLTVILFGIISLVAIFLVFCIFYMIVMEKTKDIGIIKSVGATPAGVAQIFLGYGLAIGISGAGFGWLCSYLLVHNINELHAWLGRVFHMQIWDPQVYLFDKIPNTMNVKDIAVILPIAVVSSVLGALIPAWRASRMHPVESLRWE